MINKLVQYIKDSRLELQKVVWPKRRALINSTLMVIFFSLFVAAFLGVIDFGLTKLIQLIIS
jgi:preprotein translocase subunit SecE